MGKLLITVALAILAFKDQVSGQIRPIPTLAPLDFENYTKLVHDVFGPQTTPGPIVTEKPPILDIVSYCRVNNRQGECTAYYQCSNDSSIITDGGGKRLFDLRIETECPLLRPCCFLKSNKTVVPDIPIAQGCGFRNEKGLGFQVLINETERQAQEAEFPWTVAILNKEKMSTSVNDSAFECGGSLIHPNVVVTVAHCIENLKKEALIARAGEWDSLSDDEYYRHQDREIDEIVIHEKYNTVNVFNDIALLFLKEPVTIAENVNTVCLPPLKHNFDDSEECYAAGWGQKSWEEVNYQSILKRIGLPIVPQKECQEKLRETRLGKYFELDESFVCAGGEKGVDTCLGDGGSPLMCKISGTKNRFYQAGIVSWGIGCGDEVPGVYVNVALFRDWVDDKLQEKKLETTSYEYVKHDLRDSATET